MSGVKSEILHSMPEGIIGEYVQVLYRNEDAEEIKTETAQYKCVACMYADNDWQLLLAKPNGRLVQIELTEVAEIRIFNPRGHHGRQMTP